MRNLEPIILTVALALLALVAAGLAYTFPSIEDLTTITSLQPDGHQAKAMSADDLTSQLTPWTTPVTWNEPTDKARLFKSEGYFFYASLYPNGNYIQKDDGTATTPGGILISWCQRYNLDITDPNIDREDLDKDGFSNKTEFFAGLPPGTAKADGSKSTSPIDASSHPTYLSRLRLQNFDVQPFHIQFVGVVSLEGKNLFQIALTDVSQTGQPPLKKTGDALGYENWVVGEYTPKMVQEKRTPQPAKPPRSTDRHSSSTSPTLAKRSFCLCARFIDAPDSTANFVMLMPS